MPHIHWVARQNKLETPKEKDEVNKQAVHECDGRTHDPDAMVDPPISWRKKFVYYESLKRELKTKLIYECRCDERLKTKVEESTRLGCTVLHDKTN